MTIRASVAVFGAAALAGAGQSAGPPSPPRFESGVQTVYVDVLVSHDGAPVTGLTAAQFEVKDEGVRQEVELVGQDAVPQTVFLVFDASGSVRGEKLLALRAAGSAFLDGLRPGVRTAVVAFNEVVVLLSPPGTDPAAARRALERLRPAGSTAVHDALFAAIGLAGRARSLVVLFTDGEDNVSWLSAADVRAAAERAYAVVHVIGVFPPEPPASDSIDPALRESQQLQHVRGLRQIAEVTGGRLWRAESVAQIRDAFAGVAADADARYLLRFEPKGPLRPGWHRLEVRVRGGKGVVRARRGYYAPPPGASDAGR